MCFLFYDHVRAHACTQANHRAQKCVNTENLFQGMFSFEEKKNLKFWANRLLLRANDIHLTFSPHEGQIVTAYFQAVLQFKPKTNGAQDLLNEVNYRFKHFLFLFKCRHALDFNLFGGWRYFQKQEENHTCVKKTLYCKNWFCACEQRLGIFRVVPLLVCVYPRTHM